MPTSQLTVHDVTKRYGERMVLDRVSFAVRPGEKVGVVGDNGSGKSTLLRVLASSEPVDNGQVTVVAPGGVGHLAQTVNLPRGASVQDQIELALVDVRRLERCVQEAERAMSETSGAELAAALEAYAALTARFEARGGYLADRQVDVALVGLGLPDLDRSRRLDTLSGGERSRLALAATLASDPELLLLDEPTNDLDDQAMGWLEQRLRRRRGTVVVATHDRLFLERLTRVILEVEGGQVTRYGDGYAGYLAAKDAERRRRVREHRDWRVELARNERLVENNVAKLDAIPRKLPLSGFGHGAFRARARGHGAMSRIRNAKERVERLTGEPAAPPTDPLVFAARLHVAEPTPPEWVAQLCDVVVEGRLAVPRLHLGPRDRLLVTGPNGAGKSTLLKVLASELPPDRGSVRVPLRVGHLRQEGTPWPARFTVVQAFAHARAGNVAEHAAALRALGLFRDEDLRLRVGQLSYGQRRRIDLARVVCDPVDLLLLDEPTNHLTPALVEELEEALSRYRGAVVVATHDRRMRQRFVGTRLALSPAPSPRNGRS